ncbi:hypothetical protein JW899_05495 [Candidatus Uhrbacteria bacterium]|nr:hypothetical protein [Candidatus Uhrbacteria bacterium]
MLEKEFKYFRDHQDELVRGNEDKFVVIKDGEVLGFYDTEIEALQETQKNHELGTFLIQPCVSGNDSYTQTYHSRVAF